MKKKSKVLENLKEKLKSEIKIRKEVIRTTAPTKEEVSIFVGKIIFPAFQTIENEIKPYFIKTTIIQYKYSVGFQIKESEADYYCTAQIIPHYIRLKFESRYTYTSENLKPNYGNPTIYFPNESIDFRSLNEITADTIIELFNKSFFRRHSEKEKTIRESFKRNSFYDDSSIIQ